MAQRVLAIFISLPAIPRNRAVRLPSVFCSQSSLFRASRLLGKRGTSKEFNSSPCSMCDHLVQSKHQKPAQTIRLLSILYKPSAHTTDTGRALAGASPPLLFPFRTRLFRIGSRNHTVRLYDPHPNRCVILLTSSASGVRIRQVVQRGYREERRYSSTLQTAKRHL